jgi:AcrR family transcriptional regulator
VRNRLLISKSANEAREQRILNAAAVLVMRQGYDKTIMGDVADEVGVSRGIVYLHFENKEKLFEALIQREVFQYAQTWLEHIEADPRGDTIGGINSHPLMATIMRRDWPVVGNYLRKPGNIFDSMQSSALNVEFLKSLQEAGAVRQDVDQRLMSHSHHRCAVLWIDNGRRFQKAGGNAPL